MSTTGHETEAINVQGLKASLQKFKNEHVDTGQHPDFVATYDDENDNTYGYYIFNVPEKWKNDFERIRNKKRPSDEYIEQCCSIYPKIADRLRQQFETLDRI
jgi:3'-phosphoadenosine 5'-phosphosulfate sulfotransferase (PAPS reductase)/FAD synthetase